MASQAPLSVGEGDGSRTAALNTPMKAPRHPPFSPVFETLAAAPVALDVRGRRSRRVRPCSSGARRRLTTQGACGVVYTAAQISPGLQHRARRPSAPCQHRASSGPVVVAVIEGMQRGTGVCGVSRTVSGNAAMPLRACTPRADPRPSPTPVAWRLALAANSSSRACSHYVGQCEEDSAHCIQVRDEESSGKRGAATGVRGGGTRTVGSRF